MNATSGIVPKGIQQGLEIGSFVTKNAEPLEKVAKNTYRLIDMWAAVYGSVSAPFAMLSSQLKDSVTVFESIRVFGAIKTLVCKDEDNKYFLFNEKNTWQKKVDRVCLAFHNSFKSVKGLSKAGLVQLGACAKHAIGKLPVFTLVTDGFMIGSSFFSIWDISVKGFPRGQEALKLADEKILKWEDRPFAVDLLKRGIVSKTTRNELEAKYQGKAIAIANKIEDKTKELQVKEEALQTILASKTENSSEKEKASTEAYMAIKKLTVEISKLIAAQVKNNDRLEKLELQDYKALASTFEKTVKTVQFGKEVDEKQCEFKSRQWQVKRENAQVEQNKNWIRLANSVGKVAVITLALTLIALDAWMFPCVMSLLALGFIVDSIGLTKFVYEEFAKSKPVPFQISA